MNKNIISLEVNGNNFLKKPYVRYISSGGIGEKIFEEYCKQNKINFVRGTDFMWTIYLYYKKKNDWELTRYQKKLKDIDSIERIILT